MNYVKLKDTFTIKKGKKVEVLEEYTEAAIRCIQIEDLRNNNNIKWCLQHDKYVTANEQDILIAWDGANAGTVGIGINGALGSTLAKLELKSADLNPYFVALFLQSKFDYFQQTATGATIPHISRKALEEIELPVPKLEVQNKIVEVLKQVEVFLEKRQSQITALDELTQSVFIDKFGDPKENKNHYPIHLLSDFYESPKESVKCGPFGSALKKGEYVDSGIPVWNMDNITKDNTLIDEPSLFVTEEKANKLKSYNVRQGDIIISRAGTVGKMAVVRSKFENSLISTNLIRLRLNGNLLPEYVVMLIKIFGDKVCRMRTGNDGAFTHMNTSVLNSMEFPVPPLKKQQEYINILEEIECQKSKLKLALNEMQNLYNSLLQKAFRGEL